MDGDGNEGIEDVDEDPDKVGVDSSLILTDIFFLQNLGLLILMVGILTANLVLFIMNPSSV